MTKRAKRTRPVGSCGGRGGPDIATEARAPRVGPVARRGGSVRAPCPTCPWRRSTPKRGFPGGFVAGETLVKMISGELAQVMQCHCTPDGDPEVCVGFALQVGARAPAYRLVVWAGLVDHDGLEADEELHTLESLLRTHGGKPA